MLMISYLHDKLKKILTEELADYSEGSELEFAVPEKEEFGDLSLNIAMKLARPLKKNPRIIAAEIIDRINSNKDIASYIKDINIAGPGFINIFYSEHQTSAIVEDIRNNKELYGYNSSQSAKKILIEFVSANPTGPLTIAHARQAVVGEVLHSLFTFCSAVVDKEYYLNDRGVQIQTLGKSVYLRYLEIFGEEIDFPEDCYQGEYIRQIADEIEKKYSDKYKDNEDIEFFSKYAYNLILNDIKQDLKDFRVSFDTYYSEKALADDGMIEKTLSYLEDNKYSYKKEDALWFRTTQFGDDKDRVLVKSNGEYTYLTSDIPYHRTKLERGYNYIIDILGPDHHGYIKRLEASVAALGYDPSYLKVLIVQLSTLWRGDEQLRMSTRKGEFISLRQLLDEVGPDAARYFFASRKTDTHLDFDLELAKKHTPDNPVFYVQYAYARISGLLRKAKEELTEFDLQQESFKVELIGDSEKKLLKVISRFPEIIADAAQNLEPQRLTSFLEDVVRVFQSYYSSGNKIISENSEESVQKLIVIDCFRQVIFNGLKILGIDAPERM